MNTVNDDTKESLIRYATNCPDSPSECNLVIDEIDDNKGKKRIKVVKNSEELVSLHCTWDDCDKLIYDYSFFLEHLEEHAAAATESYEDYYVCGMETCEYFTKSNEALLRHAHYHGYLERLKSIGTNYVERHDLPDCVLVGRFEFEDINQFECKWHQCGVVCNTFQDFLNHVQEHTAKMHKYCSKGDYNKCEWVGCNLKFASIYKMRDHLRSHTTEKVIACPVCGNTFASKTRFSDHRKRQLPSECSTFQCSECSKLFSSERLLRDHMRSHINHYKCSFCDMTTSRPSMLGRHIRYRHMTERPFKCSLCEYAAVTKANLELHATTHIAERLYPCVFCDATFRWQLTLDDHMRRVHFANIDTRWYDCHGCSARFFKSKHLTEHLKKTHDFNWPSGHSRFQYKKDVDGIYRLQTIRYESLEASQESLPEKLVDTSTYDMKLTKGVNSKGMASFVINMVKKPETDPVKLKKGKNN